MEWDDTVFGQRSAFEITIELAETEFFTGAYFSGITALSVRLFNIIVAHVHTKRRLFSWSQIPANVHHGLESQPKKRSLEAPYLSGMRWWGFMGP